VIGKLKMENQVADFVLKARKTTNTTIQLVKIKKD
jgi:hypothetical protein